MNGAKVIVVDDSALMRQAIETALESEYKVAASVDSGNAAVAAAIALSPDLILLDISMPGGLSGLEAGRQIKRVCPIILLIFLTEHHEKSYREAAFDAGGSGYVLKRQMASELLPAIRDVLNGKEYGRLAA